MKKGDWNCSSCGFSNFASRESCKNCNSPKNVVNNQSLIGNQIQNNNQQVMKGDWGCSSCGFSNFASRESCKNCNSPKNVVNNQSLIGNQIQNNNQQMMKGDWGCSSCGFLNFASRESCKNCNTSKQSIQKNIGGSFPQNQQKNTNLVSEDLNNKNVGNYYVKEFCNFSMLKQIFSIQLVSSYQNLRNTCPSTSLALERVYENISNESNCLNACRQVAEACLE